MVKWNEIITEMPVRNWQKIGDFNQPQSMQRADDLALMRHPKYEEKVRRIFAKAHLPIDMFFINVAGDHVGANQSEVSADHFKNLTGLAHPAADAITMLYTSSQDKVGGGLPLTGWILAHKIGECATVIPIMVLFEDQAWHQFCVQTRKLLIPRYGTSLTGKNPGTYVSSQRFFQLVFTMKSARDGRLFNFSEALAELVAQYMITGTVTFRATEVSEFDAAAEQFRAELLAIIHKTLESMRGKAFMN
jgi:hypothetical protein